MTKPPTLQKNTKTANLTQLFNDKIFTVPNSKHAHEHLAFKILKNYGWKFKFETFEMNFGKEKVNGSYAKEFAMNVARTKEQMKLWNAHLAFDELLKQPRYADKAALGLAKYEFVYKGFYNNFEDGAVWHRLDMLFNGRSLVKVESQNVYEGMHLASIKALLGVYHQYFEWLSEPVKDLATSEPTKSGEITSNQPETSTATEPSTVHSTEESEIKPSTLTTDDVEAEPSSKNDEEYTKFKFPFSSVMTVASDKSLSHDDIQKLSDLMWDKYLNSKMKNPS